MIYLDGGFKSSIVIVWEGYFYFVSIFGCCILGYSYYFFVGFYYGVIYWVAGNFLVICVYGLRFCLVISNVVNNGNIFDFFCWVILINDYWFFIGKCDIGLVVIINMFI